MSDDANNTATEMSSSLEDYLETIYQLAQEQGFARVKEIARARDVKAASVSTALRKLSDLGLVRYERREYVALTPTGEEQGRRVYARHQLLTRFFEQVLQMPSKAAAQQACAMEHSLTDEAMDRFARFFEFLGVCQHVPTDLLDIFRKCPLATGTEAPAGRSCERCRGRADSKAETSLADLRPGQQGRITHIGASGAIRQRLLDMGLLPGTVVDLERLGTGGDPVWIRCQGAHLALRRSEAANILLTKG